MSRSNYMREIYVGKLQEGVLPITTSFAKLEAEARKKLSPEAFGYVHGSASSEKTAGNNLAAFDDYQIGELKPVAPSLLQVADAPPGLC